MSFLGGSNPNFTGTGSYNDETNVAIRAKKEQQAAQFKDSNIFPGQTAPDISTATAFDRLPWKKDDGSIFWSPLNMLPERWDKIFPYRLLVVDVSTGRPNIVVSGSDGSSIPGGLEEISTRQYFQGVDYVIHHEVLSRGWQCILPITPQQLKITDQFAINTSATMRGVVEEHNGVKFKTISASGTTGIWPQRPTSGGSISSPSSLQSIAAGSIEAAQSLLSGIESLKKTAQSFSGNKKSKKQQKPGIGEANEFTTGYYQALYLGQFFERYAEAKKDPKNKGWRLVFDIPKQNQSFIVTPVAFESSQSEQKPNQYTFSFQLKAWKRIDLHQTVDVSETAIPSLDSNTFQKINRSIADTRRVLSRATNLVKAVRSDFQNVFNILRQASLAVKDLAGLVASVMDLPRQLIEDAKGTINDSMANLNAAAQITGEARDRAVGDINKNLGGGGFSAKDQSSSEKAGEVRKFAIAQKTTNEGLSHDEVASGALGSVASEQQATNPLNSVFQNPEEHFDLFDSIAIDDITLTPNQQLAVDDELLRISLLTVENFREFRHEILSLAHDIADNYGAGDSTFSTLFGLPDPKTRPIPMTVEENEVLVSLFEAVQSFDYLISTKQYDDFSIQSPLEFVGGLANESGIDFQEFSSKLLAPVPFGLTIEEIAARYMGDASKWLEIATTNKLRSPYIDEDGFIYEFLSNAEGRQFNVNDTDDNLFVGQKIVIVSDTIPMITRKIINVEKIGDGNFLVTVDGLANLGSYQTSANARMQGYLPGTVNSQNQIYIPNNLPAQTDDRTHEIANIPDSSLNKLAKVDFLLTDDSDIAINSVGDFRLASGLTNLIQSLKLKIRTQKGSLLHHLQYGLGLTHGISVSDITTGEIMKSLNAMIATDSRFQSINSLQIVLNGSTLSISMSITIANGTGIVPITFDMRAS
jgi:hypothetical protein